LQSNFIIQNKLLVTNIPRSQFQHVRRLKKKTSEKKKAKPNTNLIKRQIEKTNKLISISWDRESDKRRINEHRCI